MKYFLYFDTGSCNYGDHKTGLEQFDTLEQAQLREAEITQRDSDAYTQIIKGEMVN